MPVVSSPEQVKENRTGEVVGFARESLELLSDLFTCVLMKTITAFLLQRFLHATNCLGGVLGHVRTCMYACVRAWF